MLYSFTFFVVAAGNPNVFCPAAQLCTLKHESSAQQALWLVINTALLASVSLYNQPGHPQSLAQAAPPGQDTVMSDLRLDRSHAEDCTTVRHGQAQQSDPTSVPASVTLLDLLHEVPTLPGLLNADAQKACQLPAGASGNTLYPRSRL